MANQQDKDEFDRLSGGSFVPPTKPFPRIPDIFKTRKDYREAWEQYEKEIQKWIESGGKKT